MAWRPIRPGDAVIVAVLVAEMLRRGADADWSVKAGSLEWDVERTVVHILGSLAKHTLYLASRTSRYIAWSGQKSPGATHADLIYSVEWCGRALANVAAETPPDARAFHTLGMADAEGYVALDCFHMLEHAHDVALGLELYFDPRQRSVRRSSPVTIHGCRSTQRHGPLCCGSREGPSSRARIPSTNSLALCSARWLSGTAAFRGIRRSLRASGCSSGNSAGGGPWLRINCDSSRTHSPVTDR